MNVARAVLLIAVLFCAANPVTAQPADPSTTPTSDDSELGARQEHVEQLMLKMDRTFRSLAQQLEAEQAEKLIAALQESKKMLLADRVKEIRNLLNAARLKNATERQQQVLDDVRILLRLLLEEEQRNPLAEWEQLQLWKTDLDELRDQQRKLRRENDKLLRPEAALAELSAQIAAVKALIEEQTNLNAETAKAAENDPADLKPLAPQQEAQQSDTEAAARQIAKANARQEGAAPPKEPSSQNTPLDHAAGSQQQAGAAMKQAQAGAAADAQKKALAELEKALADLEQERRRVAMLPPEASEELARQQQAAADKAAGLQDQMKQSESSSQSGPPGAPNVSKAQQSMQQASGDLESGQAEDATEDQEAAIRELEKAIEKIEERLAQLREETQVEKLARLEQRFREMLTKQQAITKQTLELETLRIKQETFTRKDRLAVAGLAKSERALVEAADQAYDILLEDGQSVVFPSVVESLRTDLEQAADLLSERLTDTYTQAVQQEIENTLEELIKALNKAQQSAKKSESSGQGGGGEQAPQPLLPDSAELKLLRAAQLRVNRLTIALEKSRGEAELSEAQQTRLKSIAMRQEEIAKLTDRMLQRIQNALSSP